MFKPAAVTSAANACASTQSEEMFFAESVSEARSIFHFWAREQFNRVTVRIAEKDLPCPVGPTFAGMEICAGFLQMRFPRIQIVHA